MQSDIKVRVVCPGCGPLVLPAAELRCEVEVGGGKGICELRCPICSATLVVRAEAAAVDAMPETMLRYYTATGKKKTADEVLDRLAARLLPKAMQEEE